MRRSRGVSGDLTEVKSNNRCLSQLGVCTDKECSIDTSGNKLISDHPNDFLQTQFKSF